MCRETYNRSMGSTSFDFGGERPSLIAVLTSVMNSSLRMLISSRTCMLCSSLQFSQETSISTRPLVFLLFRISLTWYVPGSSSGSGAFRFDILIGGSD